MRTQEKEAERLRLLEKVEELKSVSRVELAHAFRHTAGSPWEREQALWMERAWQAHLGRIKEKLEVGE